MKHTLLITVDGYSWEATATTHHTGKVREVLAITCDNVPTRVLGALDDHLVGIHDVLEVVRNYLNDTATVRREATCGPIEFSWYPLDPDALRADLTGMTYAVKLTDYQGATHCFDVGAVNSWEAYTACLDVLQTDKPLRSSVIQPLGH